MQSGLYYGYVGLVTNIIEEIKKELGAEAKVISTGGFGAQISHEIKSIDSFEPYLVLEGLRILHQRSRE
jgi:type III pantothenate kinase